MENITKYKVLSISKIREKKNFLIEIENFGAIACAEDLLYKYKITRGKQLAKKEIDELINEQKTIEIKKIAINFISYKPRTEYQVKQKLRRVGYNSDDAEFAVHFLKEFGYLDDRAYAINFANEFLIRKPSGAKRLRQELIKRGIGKEIIDYVCNISFDEDTTYTMALQSAKKKLKAIAYKSQEKQKNSLIQYLQRQGFDWDTIKKIIEELIEKKI